eukprot:12505349-Alexandrium_andersonii.AAC.1
MPRRDGEPAATPVGSPAARTAAGGHSDTNRGVRRDSVIRNHSDILFALRSTYSGCGVLVLVFRVQARGPGRSVLCVFRFGLGVSFRSPRLQQLSTRETLA